MLARPLRDRLIVTKRNLSTQKDYIQTTSKSKGPVTETAPICYVHELLPHSRYKMWPVCNHDDGDPSDVVQACTSTHWWCAHTGLDCHTTQARNQTLLLFGQDDSPRLFMPTNRLSTRSTRPIPFFPPSSLSFVRRVAGDILTPSMAVGFPFSNSISTKVATSGAC